MKYQSSGRKIKPRFWPVTWDYAMVSYGYSTRGGYYIPTRYFTFPKWWSGWMTAIYCVIRGVGRHICFVDDYGNFETIGVIGKGKFEPIDYNGNLI